MRLFTASIATETNTFSPIPTSLESYLTCFVARPGEHPTDKPSLCTAPLFVARQRAKQEGFTLIEGSCFFAQPAGITTRRAYEAMRDEVLEQLKDAMPLDGVLLGMHGAMVADGYDDCEGDILERVRAIVGPGCVIGVELDPHCHMTLKRLGLADIIVLFKEYPHIDILPRAEELARQSGPSVKPATWDRISTLLPRSRLLVNTTLLGMTGQPPLAIDLGLLPANATVADVVYIPLDTPLLVAARARGLKTADGLGMLLHQAVRGFSLWFGKRPTVTAELRALVEADLRG